MKKATRTAKKSTTSMQSSFGGLSKSFGSMVKGAGVVALAIGAIDTAMKLVSGPALSNVEINFSKVARSVGADAKNMKAALQEASLGMMTDMELMQQASSAMVLGIDPKLLIGMMRAATAASKTMGISVSHAFDSISIGIARQSKLILDNVGIIVKADEAYESYADSIGVAVNELTAQEKTIAFNNAAMVGLNEQVKTVGATTEGTMGNTAKFVTAVGNAWDRLGDKIKGFINNILGPVNQLMKDLASDWDKLFGDDKKAPAPDPSKAIIQPAGMINGNGVAAKQQRKKSAKTLAKEKKALAAILKARQDFALQYAALQEGTQAQDLVKLAQWRDKKLALVGLSKQDEIDVERIYKAQKLEIEKEAHKELNELIMEQALLTKDNAKVVADLELQELELWYAEVLALTTEGDELRIEALKVYLERRKVLVDAAKVAEITNESSFMDRAKSIDKTGADFSKEVTKDKWSTITMLGEAALKTGTSLGKKIFIASKAVAVAQAIMDTSTAITKTLAKYGGTPMGYVQAGIVAAIGAVQVASIVSSAIGAGGSAPSVGGGGGGGGSTPTSGLNNVTPVQPDKEQTKGELIINIQGDIIGEEEWIDNLAMKISEGVDQRNVTLRSSSARALDI